jgi:hypothetical protein
MLDKSAYEFTPLAPSYVFQLLKEVHGAIKLNKEKKALSAERGPQFVK